MQAAPPSFRTQAATTLWHEIAGVHLDQCAGVLRCLKLATSSIDEDERVMKVALSKTGPWAQRNTLYVLFTKKTGYRVSEALSLRVKDMWAEGQAVRAVHVDKDRMKGKRDRKPVPLQLAVRQAIEAWIPVLTGLCGGVLDPDMPIFLSRKRRARRGDTPVFRAMSRQQAYGVVTKLYAEAGLVRDDGKALANHTLRKTFAMRIYESSGHDIFLTSKAIGHASVNMTQRYLGISDAEVIEAILAA
jgi:integrase